MRIRWHKSITFFFLFIFLATPVLLIRGETPVFAGTALQANSDIETLQAATVQIFAKFQQGNRLRTAWTGTGTIISSDGLILTNAHVAAPNAPGLATLYNDVDLLFQEPPDALVVGIVEEADEPPVETYLAEVLAADGPLDLAVIKVVATLDGKATRNLDLPFVPLGDSDKVKLGDEVRIFGFPGAGGDTITFTRGDVSGFESQDGVGNKAWIKTDATVSPGNSGGLGADAAGKIIGIPSFVQEATGGAINRLRAIKYALPLIEAAEEGEEYESPYVTIGSGDELLTLNSWALDYDIDNGCPVDPVDSYASDAQAVVAVFSFEEMTDKEQYLIAWYIDNEITATIIGLWDAGEEGDCFPSYLHNYGDPMPVGTYAVEIYAGPNMEVVGAAEVVVSDEISSSDGVFVYGRISDADTGKGIREAVIFILYPGVDADVWLEEPNPEEIYSYGETDSRGDYELYYLLERDYEYPGVIIAEGYEPFVGYLEIFTDDPSEIEVDIELTK